MHIWTWPPYDVWMQATNRPGLSVQSIPFHHTVSHVYHMRLLMTKTKLTFSLIRVMLVRKEAQK